MAVLPKRVPTRADTDRLTRTINDLIGYTGTLPTGAYLPLDGSAPMVGNLLFSADNTRDIGASGATRPRTIYLGTSLGIIASPSFPLHVEGSNAGARLVSFKQASGAGASGLYVEVASTGSGDAILRLISNGTVRYQFAGDGSFTGKGSEAVQKVPQAILGSGSDLTLGLTYSGFSTPVSVSLTPGYWTVDMDVLITCVNGAGVDVGNTVFATLVHTGGTMTMTPAEFGVDVRAVLRTNGDVYPVHRTWKVAVTASTTVEIKVAKTGGTGSSVANAAFASLVATYSGNV